MSEIKHTSGPWYVDGVGLRALVRGLDGTIVAVRHRLGSEENDANMALIAAAPDLLEGLKEMQGYAIRMIREGGAHHDPVWAKVAGAIAKAEGR